MTLGDPSGVGPELVIKAWTALRGSGPAFFAVGHFDTLCSAFGAHDIPVERVATPEEAAGTFGKALPVVEPAMHAAMITGTPDTARASAILEWIHAAVSLALEGRASGVVTAPISKAVLYEAGFGFPGHTEFLADLTATFPVEGRRGPVMLLAAADLRVALVTIHTPLARVSEALTIDKVVHTAEVACQALARDFAIARPRLALAAFNPHAGESGTIGREEIDVLAPAVARLREAGVDVTDPRPADTLFHSEARKTYDAVICLYHDQGLIPIKTIDFWGGVNVTLGLPIVRTSPDHGTGFDIAGKGVARPDSLISAIRLAGEIASRRAAATAR